MLTHQFVWKRSVKTMEHKNVVGIPALVPDGVVDGDDAKLSCIAYTNDFDTIPCELVKDDQLPLRKLLSMYL
ncbi:hypothetical protein [Fictibacillus solisalsi]|uniref:hypothetical protein n=1 Tax=Fictibacillus solisalsi TaxID=459525 RepID=UPI0011142C11|nr:hypothetical protein [Fictibacillus solisalsi]